MGLPSEHFVVVSTHVVLPGEHVVVVNTHVVLPGEHVVVSNIYTWDYLVNISLLSIHK